MPLTTLLKNSHLKLTTWANMVGNKNRIRKSILKRIHTRSISSARISNVGGLKKSPRVRQAGDYIQLSKRHRIITTMKYLTQPLMERASRFHLIARMMEKWHIQALNLLERVTATQQWMIWRRISCPFSWATIIKVLNNWWSKTDLLTSVILFSLLTATS